MIHKLLGVGSDDDDDSIEVTYDKPKGLMEAVLKEKEDKLNSKIDEKASKWLSQLSRERDNKKFSHSHERISYQ